MSTERSWQVRRGDDFGSALAELRNDRALTQLEVAERVGIDRSYLARMETGRSARLLDHYLRALRDLGAEVTVTWKLEDG